MTYDRYDTQFGVENYQAAADRAQRALDKVLPMIQEEKRKLQERRGTVIPKLRQSLFRDQGVTDPFLIESEIARQDSSLGRALSRIGDTEAGARSSFETAQSALDRALTRAGDERSRRSTGGGGGLTLLQQLSNPLATFLASGGKRTVNEIGGYSFFDKDGKPITVQEAASMTPGATEAAFLEGSRDPGDIQKIQQASAKPLSAEANKQRINGISGMSSLSQLENLLNQGISPSEMAVAKKGFTSIFAGPRAKQYRDAARNAADIIARIRTGAQINEKEMDLYLQFVPGPTDDPATRKQKLDNLRLIFQSAQQGGGIPGDLESSLSNIVDTGI